MPAKLLGQAKAQMIWAGGGVQHASAGILALAERIWSKAEVVVADIAEEYHPREFIAPGRGRSGRVGLLLPHGRRSRWKGLPRPGFSGFPFHVEPQHARA